MLGEGVRVLITPVLSSLPVAVDTSVHYKCKGKDMKLKFEEGNEDVSSTGFARQGSGFSIITRRESLMRFQTLRGKPKGLDDMVE
jgi:hypothetical protein